MSCRKLFNLMAIITFLLVILLGGLTGLAQAASGTTSNQWVPGHTGGFFSQRGWITESALDLPAAVPANMPLLQGAPVLTITKSSTNEGGAPLLPGERITYTIIISNSGDLTATNVVISDTIPANTTFIPESLELVSTSGITGTPPTLAEGITLDPASLVTVTYAVTVNSNLVDGTPIINAAAVTSTEITDPQSSTVTDLVVNQADLSIAKTNGQTQSVPGQPITYTIIVTNNSTTTPVTNATVSDNIPAELLSVSWICTPAGGASCTPSGNGNINDSTVDLPANASVTYTVIGTVSASATGLLTNTASVTMPVGVTDPIPSNNGATDSDTLTPKANLAIEKSDSPDPVFVGHALTYTLTFTNTGPSDATGVVLTDTLPVTVNFSSAPGCNHNSGQVVCNIGTLAAGLSASRTIVVTPTTAGLVANSVVISSSVSDPDESNNNDTENTTVTPHADLAISKSDTLDPVIAGETLTYTLTITNNGPSTAQSLVVSDTLPVSVTFVSAQPAAAQNGQTLTWNFASLANGATQPITVVVNVNGSARGTLTNTATVTASTADLSPGNNSDTETTTANGQADLAVSKSDSRDPIDALTGAFDYTIEITNTGPSDALGVVVTDTLPGTVSLFSTPSSSQGSCTGTTTIICNLGKIANGNNATVIISVLPSTLGIITNTVSVASSDSDSNTSNNTDTENTTIFPADLSVTKSDSPDPVLIGNPLTYTLVVENDGPNQANNVALTDTLPSSVAFKSVSGSASCAHSNGTVTCSNLGNIGAGGNRTVTIVVTPTVAGVITNTAVVTSSNPDPTPANNTSTITTTVSPVADLSIGKTASSDPVTAGTSLTYTLTITNSGPSAATGVVISDTLPGGVTFASASSGCSGTSTILCTITQTIASGSSISRTIRVNVNSTASGSLINTASVTGNEFDTNTLNNTATLTTTVNRQVNLAITKSASANPVTAGTGLTYTLTVNNAGPSSANGVVVTDTLPSGVSLVSASAGCSGATVVTCTIAGGVASGGSAAVTIRINVPAASSGVLTNVASVSSTESDSSQLNNTTTLTTSINQRSDLSISKSDSPDPVTAGNNLTYNLSVTNNGPSNATGVVMTDTLPAGVTFQTFTSGAPCNFVSGKVICNFGSLASGSQAVVTIVVKVNDTATGTLVNQATVTGSQIDPNSNNNSISVTTSVGALSFVFLPVLQKPAPTELSVFNDNTGGNVTFTVVGTGVSCTVPNNTTQFCGSFPPGIYTVQVTSACGNTTTNISYASGPITNRVFCK